jgi:hypothetical protein
MRRIFHSLPLFRESGAPHREQSVGVAGGTVRSPREKPADLGDRKGKDAVLYLMHKGRMSAGLREIYRQYDKKRGAVPLPPETGIFEENGADVTAHEPESAFQEPGLSGRPQNNTQTHVPHSQDDMGPNPHGMIRIPTPTTPISLEMQWKNNPHMAEYLDAACGIRPAALCANGLLEIAEKRGLRLRKELEVINIASQSMKLFINKAAALETIDAHPALFKIGSTFPSADAALEAICNGTSPWKLMDEYTHENVHDKSVEENMVVSGVLLGYGEQNSRNFAKAEAKRKVLGGTAREHHSDYGSSRINGLYANYKRSLGHFDLFPITFQMWDNPESEFLVHKYIEANKEVNKQIHEYHDDRLRKNPEVDFQDSVAEFVLHALLEPAAQPNPS